MMLKAIHNSGIALTVSVGLVAAPAALAQQQDEQLDQLLMVRAFDREPQGQSPDWGYAMTVARHAQKAWIIQKAASGDTAKRAYKVRSMLFIFAAREVLRWQYRYLGKNNSDDKFEGRYVLASFIGGLYMEYAGDYWQARKYLGFANAQLHSLKPGQIMPSYNNTKLDVAIERELSKIDSVITRYGSTPPYDRFAHFQMSNATMLDEAIAAADFVWEQGESDPKILDGPGSDPGATEPK